MHLIVCATRHWNMLWTEPAQAENSLQFEQMARWRMLVVTIVLALLPGEVETVQLETVQLERSSRSPLETIQIALSKVSSLPIRLDHVSLPVAQPIVNINIAFDARASLTESATRRFDSVNRASLIGLRRQLKQVALFERGHL